MHCVQGVLNLVSLLHKMIILIHKFIGSVTKYPRNLETAMQILSSKLFPGITPSSFLKTRPQKSPKLQQQKILPLIKLSPELGSFFLTVQWMCSRGTVTLYMCKLCIHDFYDVKHLTLKASENFCLRPESSLCLQRI